MYSSIAYSSFLPRKAITAGAPSPPGRRGGGRRGVCAGSAARRRGAASSSAEDEEAINIKYSSASSTYKYVNLYG